MARLAAGRQKTPRGKSLEKQSFHRGCALLKLKKKKKRIIIKNTFHEEKKNTEKLQEICTGKEI